MYDRFHKACLNIARGRRPRARAEYFDNLNVELWQHGSLDLYIFRSKYSHWILWPGKCGYRHQNYVSMMTRIWDMRKTGFLPDYNGGHLEKWPQQEVHPKISNVTHQYCILGTPRLQKNIGSLRCGGGARWSYLATRLSTSIKFEPDKQRDISLSRAPVRAKNTILTI